MKHKIIDRDAFKVMGVMGHFDSAAEDFSPLWEKEYTAFIVPRIPDIERQRYLVR